MKNKHKRYTCFVMKILREEKGLLQKDIATVLGIAQKIYSRYEAGETELPIRHLKGEICYEKLIR